ncbi:hypothetical protein FHS97_002588 [Sphingomonas endophytica]|uniref:Type VII secretion system protein EssD-like domain-containing protein n=1 Tax=Sphingomonas endophytica TaxID=869719 RepID=A0ABR6N758_9SPHN|nr:hypothetical protein [Sphingomonas endophytica]
MDANLNRGVWRTMEKEWQDAVKNDKKVEVAIKPVYTDNSKRPSSFEVNYRIDGCKYAEKEFSNSPGGKW